MSGKIRGGVRRGFPPRRGGGSGAKVMASWALGGAHGARGRPPIAAGGLLQYLPAMCDMVIPARAPGARGRRLPEPLPPMRGAAARKVPEKVYFRKTGEDCQAGLQ